MRKIYSTCTNIFTFKTTFEAAVILFDFHKRKENDNLKRNTAMYYSKTFDLSFQNGRKFFLKTFKYYVMWKVLVYGFKKVKNSISVIQMIILKAFVKFKRSPWKFLVLQTTRVNSNESSKIFLCKNWALAEKTKHTKWNLHS